MAKSLAVALLIVAAALGSARAGVEGRWVLTEQTYQGGGRNLAPGDDPLHLEFVSAPGGPAGRIWVGRLEDDSLPWPAIVVEGRRLPLTVTSLDRTVTGGVSVRYTAIPASGDDMVLEVSETYEIGEEDGILLGTIEVRFTGGERNRGGYTLHRRFERER